VSTRTAFNRSILILLAVFAAWWIIETGLLGMLTPLDRHLADTFIRISSAHRTPDPDIVIADIDEHSLAEMEDDAGRWPWPRAVYAEVVEALERYKPRAIVFDIMFVEPDRDRPQSDAYLREVLGAYHNIYLPMQLIGEAGQGAGFALERWADSFGIEAGPGAVAGASVPLLLPHAMEYGGWRLGLIDYLADSDGVGRRYYVFREFAGWRIPSLPARVAADLGRTLPHSQAIHLNWFDKPMAHRAVPFVDLYRAANLSATPELLKQLRDKIVIIGVTAPLAHDIRHTPITGTHPAVEIVATALDNLMHGDYLRPVPGLFSLAFGLLLIAAVTLAVLRRFHLALIGAALTAVTLLVLGAGLWQFLHNRIIPVAGPLAATWAYYFACAIAAYVHESRERRRTMGVFNRFLDPRVVSDLIERGVTPATMNGQQREITVLFSDIRGFTSLSETRPAPQIVALLNDYFSRQVEVIFRHGGTLDKFIGDAIMVFWGAPAADTDHAERAVAAALDMLDTLEAFRRDNEHIGADIAIGIGIHSGPAVVGFIGSEQRQDYTAIGDTVNLASRIEGLTRNVGRILVSSETRRLCGDRFEFIPRGAYAVKGRNQSVDVFEPRRKES
jgi:adenylate cyclase